MPNQSRGKMFTLYVHQELTDTTININSYQEPHGEWLPMVWIQTYCHFKWQACAILRSCLTCVCKKLSTAAIGKLNFLSNLLILDI